MPSALLCLWLLPALVRVDAFSVLAGDRRRRTRTVVRCSNQPLPLDLQEEVRSIAQDLWGAAPLEAVLPTPSSDLPTWGECPFLGTDYAQRAKYFQEQAELGDAHAQHSYGLLLWSGFGGVSPNAFASARWHAAAAAQHHLDALAVLGGCLRTGTGVKRPNKEQGLRLIEYSCQARNPTGINKQAALEEAAGKDEAAFRLYQRGADFQPNALLWMNLGYCFVHGMGTKKDVAKGEDCWRRAAALAPDEGSEEAAWLLYEQYARDDPREADKWLQLAEDLGYDEALLLLP
jgi:TPR repeat protein